MRILRWACRFWTGVLALIVLSCGLLLGLRLLAPLLPASPSPHLLGITPDAANLVAPNTALMLRFSTPMNPRSVERHLSLQPDTPHSLAWNDDHTELTLVPVAPLRSGTRYSIKLGVGANSRLFRPLDADAMLQFSTVPAPVVLAAFPAPGSTNAPRDTPITLSFSRPIVPTDTLTLPPDVALLRFEPPLEGATTWLDPSTALFRPIAPLQAGTHYTATLDAGLVDTVGGQLERPYVWSFSTSAPRVLVTSPAHEAASVALRAPLSLLLSQPFDLEAVRAALVITPAIEGQLSAATLPDATQVITFTPASNWQPNAVYQVALNKGVLPVAGNLPLDGAEWSFRTAPRISVVGRFPGEGQTLPEGQALRLVFSTPVEATALAGALQITPDVGEPRVTISGNEARIVADFAPASVYTLTLRLDAVDATAGVPGELFEMRFQTAAAAPALVLTQLEGRVLRLTAGAIGPVVQRVNVAALEASLYPIDQATAVRLLDFSPGEWRDFSPGRYGLAPLRVWSQVFTDTANVRVEDQLALLDGAAPLSPGVFYLRLRTPEQVRADALLFVSDTTLVLRRSGQTALVWAVGSDGVPRSATQLALYRNGALIAQGQSGETGWQLDVPGPDRVPLVALSDDGALAIGGITSGSVPLRYRITVFTERARFKPGETVNVGGFARTPDDSAIPGLRGTITLRSSNGGVRVATQSITLDASGVIRASLQLPPSLVGGEYELLLSLGDAVATSTITVVDPAALLPVLDVAPLLVAGEPLTFTLTTTPAASVPVTWTVRALPDAPLADRFLTGASVVSDATLLAGSGRTDALGSFVVTISDTLQISLPLRYQIEARVGSDNLIARAETRLLPAREIVGLRLASRIATTGELLATDVLVQDANGQPVENREVLIELLRLPASGSFASTAEERRARVVLRTSRTDAGGRASVELTAREAGSYMVRASMTDAEGRNTSARLPLWVTAASFDRWASGTPVLIADQARYQLGETARLLLTTPFAPSNALIITQHDTRISAELRALQSGVPLTVTIEVGDAPLLPVEVLFRDQDDQLRSATVQLPVAQNDPLAVTLASDAAEYAPGAMATFTVTTTVQPDAAPASIALAVTDQQAGTTIAFLPEGRADASGLLTVTLRLPNMAGQLVATAWAAGKRGTALAQTTLAVTEPLALQLAAPPLVRAGDQVVLAATLRNTSTARQTVQTSLAVSGLRLNTGALTSTETLDAGELRVITWRVTVEPAERASAQMTAIPAGSRPQSIRQIWDVLPDSVRTGQGALVDGNRMTTLLLPPGAGPLALSVAPTVAALERELLTTLSARAERSPANDALLLLVSAPISGTRTLAQSSLAALLGNQAEDGGWQLWPGEPSNSELTVLVIEALAEARSSGLNVPDTVLRRALASFGASNPDLVKRLYAESRFGRTDRVALAELIRAAPTLDSASIALLLLSDQLETTDAQALVDMLIERIIDSDTGARVTGTSYGGDLLATALAAQALATVRPGTTHVVPLLRTLAAARSPGGWQNSIVSARSFVAIRTGLQERGPSSYELWLNNNQLLAPAPGSTALTDLRRLTIPASELRASTVLTATASGGPIMLAYETDSAVVRDLFGVRLLREYLDPTNGQPLNLAALEVGTTVQVRLTMLVPQPVRYLEISDPLPSGTALLDGGTGDIEGVAHRGQIVIGRSRLEPGVYQYRYSLRIIAAGRFSAPAPAATLSDSTRIAEGRAVILDVRK